MTRPEFIALIGQDIVVDYPFFKEIQQWSMKNFSYDPNDDIITNNRFSLIVELIFPMRNPHKGKPTHG